MHPTRIFRTTGFRLAALYAGLFGLSVAILFGVIYWDTAKALRDQVVTSVTDEVAALTAEGRAPDHIAREIDQRLASGPRTPHYYLLLDAQGQKRRRQPARLRAARSGCSNGPFRPTADADGEGDHRLLAFGERLPGGAMLVVGDDLHRIIELKEAIVQAFGWAFGATVVLGALGGVLMSLGFLRRVDAMNRTTRAIIDGNLSDRVPTRGTGDELDSLAVNLNRMLDSVQALMESLRQVSSDIAHDLRTPLTRLRQRLETIQGHARSAEEYRAAIDEAIVDTNSILGTFAALLRIAQIEAGHAARRLLRGGTLRTVRVDRRGLCTGRRGQRPGTRRCRRTGTGNPRRPRAFDPDAGQPRRKRDPPHAGGHAHRDRPAAGRRLDRSASSPTPARHSARGAGEGVPALLPS